MFWLIGDSNNENISVNSLIKFIQSLSCESISIFDKFNSYNNTTNIYDSGKDSLPSNIQQLIAIKVIITN